MNAQESHDREADEFYKERAKLQLEAKAQEVEMDKEMKNKIQNPET